MKSVGADENYGSRTGPSWTEITGRLRPRGEKSSEF